MALRSGSARDDSASKTRAVIVLCIIASMFMVAIEATIVSTAMPRIAAALGDLYLYGWVFSSFLFAQTAMTVVFGSLADAYGRRSTILTGIAFFLIGSVSAGAATSMLNMIAARTLQGIGAGAVQPIAMTIVGDLFPGKERAKVQGYLSSMWAISALLGPIAGAFVVKHFSWSWVFWINVPVGCLAAAGFAHFLKEDTETAFTSKSLDIVAILLLISLCFLLAVALAAEESGHAILLFLLLPILLIVCWSFFVRELNSERPVIPLALWRQRSVAVCNSATALANMALIGLTLFLPMYVQTVLHRSAITAGLTLTVLLIGWSAGSILVTRLFPLLGLRLTLTLGSLIVPIGAAPFALLATRGVPVLATGSMLMGFGMGLLSVSALMIVQELVSYRQRASATASNIFARNVGSALGAAFLGGVLDHYIALNDTKHILSSEQLRRTLDSNGIMISDQSVSLILNSAMHLTFCVMLVFCLALPIIVAFLPSTPNDREPISPKTDL